MRWALLLAICCTLPLFADRTSMHAYHTGTLEMQCGACHVPVTSRSFVLKKPGHEQCVKCHPSAFREGRLRTVKEENVCAQCHGAHAREPLHLVFSHERHTDGLGRRDAATGSRADCLFCHTTRARLPGHTECAACHSKPGTYPRFPDCRGCHHPEQPGVALVSYSGIRFSHDTHQVDCSTCHSIAASLPAMLDCAGCHDAPRKVAAQFRISSCGSCHTERISGPAPSSHNRNIRPASHDESFRLRHAEFAAASGAKCYACHLNTASGVDCEGCHQVMRPASHTPRWKDDVHGKFAALDRAACGTCHTADSCVRCHNQQPRSHAPLALFKNGGHAILALENERACLTCHTFQDTCASCHKRSLR